MAIAYLIAAFTLNSVANIFLKLAAERGLTLSGSFGTLLTANWQLLMGLVLFAANVLFYFLALRALPLSVAYPVMVAMTFLIVNGYALFMLAEPITPLQIIGYVLIVIGLTCVVARIA